VAFFGPADGSSKAVARTPRTPGRPERFGRTDRLIRSSDFENVYTLGQRFHGRYLTLWWRRSSEGPLRMGVVASRKVGGAVQRNRVKRILREIWRRHRKAFSGSGDVILSGRSEALSAGYRTVEAEFLCLAGRAGLLAAREAI